MIAERALLPELREQIRRIERPAAATHEVLPFGVAAIDGVLPGGGLSRGALHEILGLGGDEEDGVLAAAFAAGIVGRLARLPTSPSPSLTRQVPSLSPKGGGLVRGNFSCKRNLCQTRGRRSQIVLRGLDPRIHVFVSTDPRRGCPRIYSVG